MPQDTRPRVLDARDYFKSLKPPSPMSPDEQDAIRALFWEVLAYVAVVLVDHYMGGGPKQDQREALRDINSTLKRMENRLDDIRRDIRDIVSAINQLPEKFRGVLTEEMLGDRIAEIRGDLFNLTDYLQ